MKQLFIDVVVFCFFAVALSGCTLSMQNISTHGTATDLVDQNLEADADVKPNLNIPAIPAI